MITGLAFRRLNGFVDAFSIGNILLLGLSRYYNIPLTFTQKRRRYVSEPFGSYLRFRLLPTVGSRPPLYLNLARFPRSLLLQV